MSLKHKVQDLLGKEAKVEESETITEAINCYRVRGTDTKVLGSLRGLQLQVRLGPKTPQNQRFQKIVSALRNFKVGPIKYRLYGFTSWEDPIGHTFYLIDFVTN